MQKEFTKLTSLSNLVRPWVQDDPVLLRAMRETLEGWEAELQGEKPRLVKYSPLDNIGTWPAVDHYGNYVAGWWDWPTVFDNNDPDQCGQCGAHEQLTHAPWCHFKDGTPVPEDCVDMLKARTKANVAIGRMIQFAPNKPALLWAVADLLHSLGSWVKNNGPLVIPF